jgi:hypothetical protein
MEYILFLLFIKIFLKPHIVNMPISIGLDTSLVDIENSIFTNKTNITNNVISIGELINTKQNIITTTDPLNINAGTGVLSIDLTEINDKINTKQNTLTMTKPLTKSGGIVTFNYNTAFFNRVNTNDLSIIDNSLGYT